MSILNPYLKFVVALLGAAVTSASTFYGTSHWLTVLSTVVTALTVYLTPNIPKVPASEPVKSGDPASE